MLDERYSKVEGYQLWKDEKVRQLSRPPPNGRDCWIYLLAPRQSLSIPGLLPEGAGTMADNLKWTTEGFLQVFAEVEAQGMAIADWDAPLVFLPNALKYNPPANPSVIQGWAKVWSVFPESWLLTEAWQQLYAGLQAMKPAWAAETFRKAIPKPKTQRTRCPPTISPHGVPPPSVPTVRVQRAPPPSPPTVQAHGVPPPSPLTVPPHGASPPSPDTMGGHEGGTSANSEQRTASVSLRETGDAAAPVAPPSENLDGQPQSQDAPAPRPTPPLPPERPPDPPQEPLLPAALTSRPGPMPELLKLSDRRKPKGKGRPKGEKPPEKPPNPRHAPLCERLKAKQREVLGGKATWDGRDSGALAEALADAEAWTDDEIVTLYAIAIDPGRIGWPYNVTDFHEAWHHRGKFRPPRAPEPEPPEAPKRPPLSCSDEAEAAWSRMLETLRLDGKSYALSWLDRLCAVRLEDGVLLLAAQDRFFCDWVQDQYGKLLDEDVGPRAAGVTVRFAVADDIAREQLELGAREAHA